MSNPDGVLAAIDACLDDYELSDDAMRWAPDEPDPAPDDGLCPYCSHGLPLHLRDCDGFFVCSRSLYELPSCTACQEAQGLLQHSATALTEWIDRCSRDLFRSPLPSWQRAYLNIAEGETFVTAGEYVLTVERTATALSGFVGELQEAARAALGGLGKAFTPFFAATRSALHKGAYSGDRKHYRRCPTCNPRGFPKPLPINGHEYHRRQRRRNRR
jgi:hypothetical protein